MTGLSDSAVPTSSPMAAAPVRPRRALTGGRSGPADPRRRAEAVVTRVLVSPPVHPQTSPVPPAAAHPVDRHPSTLMARAWWGDGLVAESAATVRVEPQEAPPALYFPRHDVRLDRFEDGGR